MTPQTSCGSVNRGQVDTRLWDEEADVRESYLLAIITKRLVTQWLRLSSSFIKVGPRTIRSSVGVCDGLARHVDDVG